MAAGMIAFRASYSRDELIITVAKIRARSSVIVREIEGSRMALDLRDVGISRELALKGVHEANSTQQFRNEIKPGMTVVEVGANIGYYALIEARIIGSAGRIYAFEPSPDNFVSLERNLALNGADAITEAHQMAVGAESGTSTLYMMDKGNTSSLIKRGGGDGISQVAEIEVETVTLDEFFDGRDVKIDYFRMDVEGFETEIIQGMSRILSSPDRPAGAFVEVHSVLLQQRGNSARLFVETFVGLGYRVKTARYRGRNDVAAYSTEELLSHPLLERGYWETFFERQDA